MSGKITEDISFVEELTPTQSLYQGLFEDMPKQDIDEGDLPELLAILDTLNLHEADAIKRSHGIGCERQTLQGIGKTFGVTAERARQIILKATRKLKHPSRAQQIEFLFTPRADLRKQVIELEERIRDLILETIQAKAKREAIQRSLRHCTAVLSSHFAETNGALPDGIPIEDLDFSVRTFNCLKRARIDTLADLLERNREDVLKIRECGKRSLDEVENKLSELGLHLQSNGMNNREVM